MMPVSALSHTDPISSLPRWDLSDFYLDIHDPKIEEDLLALEEQTQQFIQKYQTSFSVASLAIISPEILYDAITNFETIREQLGRFISYSYLLHATHLDNAEISAFFQKIQEKATQLSSELVFFTLAIAQIDNSFLDTAFQAFPKLEKYRSWIQKIGVYRQHQLSEDQEKILQEKAITGRHAWVRLYDETLARLRFNYREKSLPLSHVLNLTLSAEKTERQDAAKAIAEGLETILPIVTMTTNVLAKDKEIEDTWRRFPRSVSARNLSNQIEDTVVETLVHTVRQNYPELSHRYYAWKAKFMGCETLSYWDRNAPLLQEGEAAPLIPWPKAQEIVLQAYKAFDSETAEIVQKFFDRGWIDAPAQANKQSGAFAHPTVPSVHPYILLNYQGRPRDVMTLAHELGHGVHQILASEQGYLGSQTPLTLAETASVFGEMLTFQSILQKTPDTHKIPLLASKIEDMLNTVVRQTAFFLFEERIHAQRRKKELSSPEITEIWLATQKEALGHAVDLDPTSHNAWAYISHFIHAPFYVYAYAFGDCLVNSLYALYQQGYPDFLQHYKQMLIAGGTKTHHELLEPFGLKATDPHFWQQGLQMIHQFIAQLESLTADARP